MDLMKKKFHIISPHPLIFSIFLFCTIYTGVHIVLGIPLERASRASFDARWTFPLYAYFSWYFGRFYVISEKGIWVWILCYPSQRIPWETIKDVLFFQKSNNEHISGGLPLFVITTKGCAVYDPDTYTVSEYMQMHDGVVHRIITTKGDKARCMALFEKYIGKVTVYE